MSCFLLPNNLATHHTEVDCALLNYHYNGLTMNSTYNDTISLNLLPTSEQNYVCSSSCY
jgi:hypothetical protein